MDMIERVARAISAAKGVDPERAVSYQQPEYVSTFPLTGPFYIPQPDMQTKAWGLFVPDALAAIEAMRHPTPDMVDAGRDVGPDAPYGVDETTQRWGVMIDAALGPEQPQPEARSGGRPQ